MLAAIATSESVTPRRVGLACHQDRPRRARADGWARIDLAGNDGKDCRWPSPRIVAIMSGAASRPHDQ